MIHRIILMTYEWTFILASALFFESLEGKITPFSYVLSKRKYTLSVADGKKRINWLLGCVTELTDGQK